MERVLEGEFPYIPKVTWDAIAKKLESPIDYPNIRGSREK
jgi:hypothetical protein